MFKCHVNNIVCFIFLLAVYTANRANSQNMILNGSFEINNAPFGVEQVELSNAQFNNLLPYCHSFGTANDHHIDLMANNQFNDTPLLSMATGI